MASFGGQRKRGRPDGALNGHGGAGGGPKRAKESDSGSKMKPCTKFFSTTGCQFGESCHFLHYVPGGFNAIAQTGPMGKPAFHAPARGPMGPPMPEPHGPSPAMKTKMCNKFNTPEGCKFGDKCNFAHGKGDLAKMRDGPMGGPPMMGPGPMGPGRMRPHMERPHPGFNPANFGASATAKISVDASLAGGIIGKGGVNTKHISRVTGAKIAIRDHEADTNMKNIELEGTFDQINQASAMVRELIVNISASNPMPMKKSHQPAAHPPSANNFKTKLCDNFTKGTCTFGDRCHFAHGEGELRKTAAA